MNIFTKTQFTEWAEPIPASEVHPPCSRGAIVREPTEMETKGKTGGGGEAARKKGGWGIERVICICTYCTYVREEKWAFPSEFKSFLRTSTARASI